MEPYYADEFVTLFHGDCREVDEWRWADVVVTDPPYGMGHYETDVAVLDGPTLAEWVKRFRAVGVFGYPERLVGLCVAARVVPDEWVTWWPTNAAIKAYNMNGLWGEAECVATFGRNTFETLRVTRTLSGQRAVDLNPPTDRPTARGDSNGDRDTRRLGDVWTDPADGLGFRYAERLHPNQKPLPVMVRLVSGLSAGLHSVADPFAGSGSTLVAAKALGRRCIGVELVEEHCETIAKRLTQGVLDFAGVARAHWPIHETPRPREETDEEAAWNRIATLERAHGRRLAHCMLGALADPDAAGVSALDNTNEGNAGNER